jgi:virginiamycin B lyase
MMAARRSEQRSFRVATGSARARLVGAAILTVLVLAPRVGSSAPAGDRVFFGHVQSDGKPVPGAMVSFSHGQPRHIVTIFSDDAGRYLSPPLEFEDHYTIRVRRVGWKDVRMAELAPGSGESLDIELERETDPALLVEQLPANLWFGLVLERIEDEGERRELKQQCTFCHQQGNFATHRERSREEWEKLILLMGRRGAMITKDLRDALPDHFMAAYAPEHAWPRLLANDGEFGPLPVPGREARRAVIEEWELGTRASTQHDVMIHPDGRIYSVDGPQDFLHRLDLGVPGGKRESFKLPHGDLRPGGVFASSSRPTSTSNSYVSPHSLQTASDGSIWITLSSGNQLARFDVRSETFEIHDVAAGIYPHTLRFDQKGRIWYTMAATNHIGMFDPKTNEQRHLRLPARTWTQEIILRTMPYLLKLGNYVDLRSQAADGDGIKMPIPYGIDIAPDGGVWFSQLNEHRIGRVDPETLDYEIIDTPFETPRRLRFDSRGRLWIPSFSEALISRFDLDTRKFETWDLPIEPLGSETPYALHVERQSDDVWICGTNSDTMIRFQPGSERFTVYPLPSRVTYTREVDFDAQGRVWTSNSNGPSWQIEGGFPQVVRIDPTGAPRPAESRFFSEARRVTEARPVSEAAPGIEAGFEIDSSSGGLAQAP